MNRATVTPESIVNVLFRYGFRFWANETGEYDIFLLPDKDPSPYSVNVAGERWAILYHWKPAGSMFSRSEPQASGEGVQDLSDALDKLTTEKG